MDWLMGEIYCREKWLLVSKIYVSGDQAYELSLAL